MVWVSFNTNYALWRSTIQNNQPMFIWPVSLRDQFKWYCESRYRWM